MSETKKCPYCGETIMADATKCRYCKEWLSEPDNKKNTSFLGTQSHRSGIDESEKIEEKPKKPKKSFGTVISEIAKELGAIAKLLLLIMLIWGLVKSCS